MKHLTASDAKEMHYIPANNVYAFYLIGGEEGAKAEVVQEAITMDENAAQQGMCSTCRLALQQWYQRSCSVVIKRLVAKQKENQDYLPLVSPCWAKDQ